MIWWSEDTPYIEIFGLNHLIYVLILMASITLLLIFRKSVVRNRKKFAIFLLTVSVLQQILLYSWYTFETGFDMSDALPFHICRIATLLGIIFLLTKNKHILEIIFYFGLFAYGSFFYPSRIHPIYHVMGISFLVNHTLTVLLPYFGYIAYGWRPKLKGLFRVYGYFLIYFAFVYFLNPLIDGNYFYLKYRPFFSSWPDYIYVPVVLIVVFIGFLFAYWIVSLIKRKGEKVKLESSAS